MGSVPDLMTGGNLAGTVSLSEQTAHRCEWVAVYVPDMSSPKHALPETPISIGRQREEPTKAQS